jgi:protein-tyrosine-phosphatase
MAVPGPPDLPAAVLFACLSNAIRSPMAEGILKHLMGHRIFVDSIGVRAGEPDPFAIAVMDEIGIDISRHRAKTFDDDLVDTSYDLIVTFAPEAHHKALELTRTMAVDVEYWPTHDPSLATGSREQIMDAYRAVRDGLMKRIKERFVLPVSPVV